MRQQIELNIHLGFLCVDCLRLLMQLGRSPLDLAEANGHAAVAKYLKEQMVCVI